MVHKTQAFDKALTDGSMTAIYLTAGARRRRRNLEVSLSLVIDVRSSAKLLQDCND